MSFTTSRWLLAACLLSAQLVGGAAAQAQAPIPLLAPRIDAWPIVINRPGHYVLAAPLEVPAGRTAIRIAAAGVVLDLGGHRVAGPGACSLDLRYAVACSGQGPNGRAVGVLVEPAAAQAVVRNGEVRGFDTGLSLAATSRLMQLTVSHNGLAGVEVRSGAAVELSEVRAELNDTALYAVEGRMRIEGSRLQYNGIALWADPSSTLADSVVSDNGQGLAGSPALLQGSRVSANRMDASPRRF
jgi:nitrous oxidase accessory protein NosD